MPKTPSPTIHAKKWEYLKSEPLDGGALAKSIVKLSLFVFVDVI